MRERSFGSFMIALLAVAGAFFLCCQPAFASTGTDQGVSMADMKKSRHVVVIRIGDRMMPVVPLDGDFEEKDGSIYYRKKDGSLAKKQFFTKGKNVYRADRNGKIMTGFRYIKGNYYAFGSRKGALKLDRYIRGVRITREGVAENRPENIARIKMYLTAKNIVASITTPFDSKEQKLYKCYQWIAGCVYKQFRTMQQVGNTDDWDVVFANDIFEQHAGCCMSESCAFAYLAKECGYEDVTICSDGGHGWVDIGGRLYDPLFAEARSFQANYNAPYTDYRSNARIRKAV